MSLDSLDQTSTSHDLVALVSTSQVSQPSSQQQDPLAINNGGVSSKTPRLRGKGKIGLLTKQLDEVKQQFNDLSIVNKHLNIRNQVLNKMIDCLDQYRDLIRQVSGLPPEVESNLHSSAVISKASKYKAVMKDLTPAKFISMYKCILSDVSRWVTIADAGLTEEQEAKLKAVVDEASDAMYYAGVAYPTVAESASIELLKQIPADASEEEHWLDVVQAMELTEEQEMQFLVARDIIIRVSKRADMERQELGVTLSSSIVPLAKWTTSHPMGTTILADKEEEVVERIAATIQNQCSIVFVFGIFMCSELLTPLQLARCALHAYPLVPLENIMLSAVAAFVERRNQATAAASELSAAASSERSKNRS